MIKIGDFANIFGVSIKTIRFYEEKKLLKPAYVDNYTGYRYYDEKNIDEMTKILAYKSLGFELSEIRDIHDDSIKMKIDEYKKKIELMHSQINALNTLLENDKGDVIAMNTFINDENAIGKWSLLGLAKTKNDFNNNNLLDERIVLNELYFMDNGEKYWVISWTKGVIYIKDKPYNYEIENNKMYINLQGLYGEDEKVAVYEKIDDKHYTVEEIMNKDNTNVPFEEDVNLIGLWKSLGSINDKENLDLSQIDEGIIDRLAIFPEGKADVSYKNNNSRTISYTKGYIKNLCCNGTMCSYEIKNLNNKSYLIVEWKSNDYIFSKFVDCYYVFEKVNI